ncbi:MAG: Ig-like domain-containing protein [Cyclobacteriaceae bacterium]
MKKTLLLFTILYSTIALAQQKIADQSTTSGAVSYIVTEPDDSKLVFRGSGATFYFVNLENLSITNKTYVAFTEEEKAGNVVFGRGTLTSESSDLTFVTTSDAFHLDYYSTGDNWPRIFTQASDGAYFGSGRFDPDEAGRDFIRLSSDLTTVTRPFNLVEGEGVDLINKNIYQVQMTPFGDNKLLVKAKKSLTDEEYFVWDDTNETLTQLTDIENSDPDETHAVNWPLAKAYGNNVVFFYKDQLFSSDGTAAGTQLISSVSILDLEAIGGADDYVLYANDDSGDTELYLYTDGGSPTKIDLNTSSSSSPTDFVSNGSLMMFIADDGTGYEPFISDGSLVGTKKLVDINESGASMSPSSGYNIKSIIPAGTGFIFSAYDGTSTQIYYTDGTNVVALNNADEYNGYASGAREALSATDDFAYFSDQDGNIFSVAIPDNILMDEQWTSDAPQADQSLYFTSDYTFSSNLVIHSAHIPSGITVTVPDGITLEITSVLHKRGQINVESGGTLIYTEPVNTIELQSTANKVDEFLSSAQTGSEPGQYPTAAIDQLTDSLSKANTIIEEADDPQAISQMAENLHKTLIDVRWQEVQAEFVYLNNLETMIGDLKQAQIRNLLTSKSQVDYLLLGMREARMMGVRINIFANGFNPNEEMFDYFYEQAVYRGFKIFANPAEWAGGKRIACNMLSGDLCDVRDDAEKTQILIDRVKEFASQYKCDWINAFNEDGAPDGAWSIEQFNLIYSSLYNNVNGADLIGPCAWGIPASISGLNNTDIKNYVTVATTHNLGFNHDKWDEFIAAAGNLPVWDSETNFNDKYGTGTRLEVAVAAGVQGLVFYDNWKNVNLTNGALSASGLNIRDTYSALKVLASSLTISGSSDVQLTKSTNLSAEVLPADNTNKGFVWSSSDENIATVDEHGTVTGVALGEATITATTTDGSGVSGSFTITVGPLLVTSISIQGENEMIHHETQTLTATVLPENANDKSYSWSSSDEAVATIDGEGEVTAVSVGNATITATANDESTVTNTFDIVVSPLLVSSIQISGETEMKSGTSQTISAEVLPSNATNGAILWESNQTEIATVNEQGLVMALAAGTATITATATDESEISGELSLTIIEVLANDEIIHFAVFPNPSNGQFSLNLPISNSDLSYHIFNTAGQLVQSGKVPVSRQILLSTQAKGVFNLIIRSENKTYSSRLIIH